MHQLDLDPPVFAIPFQVLWRVADNVLVAQFDADLLRDIGEFVEVLHREVPSACLFRDFAQQAGPASSSAVRLRVDAGSKMPMA